MHVYIKSSSLPQTSVFNLNNCTFPRNLTKNFNHNIDPKLDMVIKHYIQDIKNTFQTKMIWK